MFEIYAILPQCKMCIDAQHKCIYTIIIVAYLCIISPRLRNTWLAKHLQCGTFGFICSFYFPSLAASPLRQRGWEKGQPQAVFAYQVKLHSHDSGFPRSITYMQRNSNSLSAFPVYLETYSGSKLVETCRCRVNNVALSLQYCKFFLIT